MRYRNRIRNIEKRLNHLNNPGRDVSKNSLNDENIRHQKLSEVKDRLMTHYKSNCSHNTFRSYLSSYDNFIKLIGDKDINLIDMEDLENFKTKRSNEVNFVSTNIDVRNIKAIFNKMAEFKMIEKSEISGIKQFKIENKKVLAIDAADIVRILNSTKDVQMTQIIRITLLTASRISEVLNIKIKDIDFRNSTLSIHQQKSNSNKTIPLTDRVLELINEIAQSNNQIDLLTLKECYLFNNKIKNDPYTRLRTDTVSKKFKKTLRKLNLSSEYKFHSLRHSAITELIMNNVPLNVVKEIAGHKSIMTTMLYCHVRSEDMKQAVNSLNY